MKKRLISFISTLALALSMCSLISAETINAHAAKIDILLQQKMNTTTTSEKIPIVIWLEDIDHDSILEQAKINTNYDETASNKSVLSLQELQFLDSIATSDVNQDITNYLNQTKEQRAADLQQTNSFILEKRNLSKSAYQTHNSKFVQELNLNNIEFISQYAPLIICNASINDIKNLIKNDSVTNIYYHDDAPVEDYLSSSLPTINGSYTRNVQGLTGDGVKIGQIEAGIPFTSHSDFSDSSITFPSTLSFSQNMHATWVAGILVGKNGMAPDAQLYSVGINENSSFYTVTETLLNSGVHVINMSAGWSTSTGTYDSIANWVDHIVHQHNVSFVAAAGNNGASAYVSTPALAYNCIAVGGISDEQTTDVSNDVLYDNTSQKHLVCNKPEVYAPAVLVSAAGYEDNGTSAAAPHVAGLIAQLIEAKPSIAAKPNLIKALVMVGGHDFNNRNTYNNTNSAESFYCAGVVDSLDSFNTVRNNRFTSGTLTNSYTKTITVSGTVNFIRIVLVWNKQVSSNNHTGTINSNIPLTDINMALYDPNGNMVGYSASPSPFEIIHFPTTQTGTYTLQIAKDEYSTTSESFAIAWQFV
ncbi:MAG: S8 family serine peptidase [Clostridia bacterium]|nr:S8 family serine peptidase [Clostridia bacterium]